MRKLTIFTAIIYNFYEALFFTFATLHMPFMPYTFQHFISSQHRTIRQAYPTELDSIMSLISAAKSTMRATGNFKQWINGYPTDDVIRKDIELHGGYVVEECEELIGYFACLPSPEPTYSKIYNGKWLNEQLPYHVVHRIAGRPDKHGLLQTMVPHWFSIDKNIRIDTHRDNQIMQHSLFKHGFNYCGIIYLASGDERLAYQKIETH